MNTSAVDNSRFCQLNELRVPLFIAPMFLVSGVDLIVAAGKSGVVGAIPSLNGRTHADFRNMLTTIEEQLAKGQSSAGKKAAPYAVNLIVHRSNPRFKEDLDACAEFKVPIVITSLGSPREVVEVVHGYGGLVFSDVASVEHARKAAACGVDGLILVCAGAGGHAGVLNPFVFVPAVRSFFPGRIALAGGIETGEALAALKILGADFGYAGTRFIATQEAQAPAQYKEMLVTSTASDIVYTPIVSGTPANFLRQSLLKCGYNLEQDAVKKPMDLQGEIKAWKDAWSAGQGVELINEVKSVEEIISAMESGYRGRPTSI